MIRVRAFLLPSLLMTLVTRNRHRKLIFPYQPLEMHNDIGPASLSFRTHSFFDNLVRIYSTIAHLERWLVR
jgi:hypothetical protein